MSDPSEPLDPATLAKIASEVADELSAAFLEAGISFALVLAQDDGAWACSLRGDAERAEEALVQASAEDSYDEGVWGPREVAKA